MRVPKCKKKHMNIEMLANDVDTQAIYYVLWTKDFEHEASLLALEQNYK